uniref:Uncharacterized protein n=1 Tax=Lotharella globosa TaxID=91324 RepID=A0A7S3YL30_9EUKA
MLWLHPYLGQLVLNAFCFIVAVAAVRNAPIDRRRHLLFALAFEVGRPLRQARGRRIAGEVVDNQSANDDAECDEVQERGFGVEEDKSNNKGVEILCVREFVRDCVRVCAPE